jgi:hypothetical protein
MMGFLNQTYKTLFDSVRGEYKVAKGGDTINDPHQLGAGEV